MTPREFVQKLSPYAQQTEKKTGISALAILTQAALESGWGKSAPGNMFFGVKDTDGLNGNEQLLTTHEYNKSATKTAKQVGLVSIDRIEPVMLGVTKYFKYTGKAYFRKYATPEQSFSDHAMFLKVNPRYAEALKVADDPELFLKKIAQAGYAQNPDYSRILIDVLHTVIKFYK